MLHCDASHVSHAPRLLRCCTAVPHEETHVEQIARRINKIPKRQFNFLQHACCRNTIILYTSGGLASCTATPFALWPLQLHPSGFHPCRHGVNPNSHPKNEKSVSFAHIWASRQRISLGFLHGFRGRSHKAVAGPFHWPGQGETAPQLPSRWRRLAFTAAHSETFIVDAR